MLSRLSFPPASVNGIGITIENGLGVGEDKRGKCVGITGARKGGGYDDDYAQPGRDTIKQQAGDFLPAVAPIFVLTNEDSASIECYNTVAFRL